jgi:hypothetical protein
MGDATAARAPRQSTGEVSAMTVTYEIRIRGRIGEVVASAFVGFDVSTHNVETVLSGPVTDQAELFTLLAQLQSFGFELVDVRQLSAPPAAPAALPPESN